MPGCLGTSACLMNTLRYFHTRRSRACKLPIHALDPIPNCKKEGTVSPDTQQLVRSMCTTSNTLQCQLAQPCTTHTLNRAQPCTTHTPSRAQPCSTRSRVHQQLAIGSITRPLFAILVRVHLRHWTRLHYSILLVTA